MAARDIEGGTAKMEDEYQVSDDLTQENENPQEVRGDNIWPVRSVPPISVALPAQSAWLGASQSGTSSTENSNGGNQGIEAHHRFFLFIFGLACLFLSNFSYHRFFCYKCFGIILMLLENLTVNLINNLRQ